MSPQLHRILLVEDDADIREITILSLEAFGGYEVKPCSSGQEALVVAQEARPDLVLLDFMMPGMDGAETLAKLREIDGFEATPIIFLTASAQESDLQRFRGLGAAGVITKPFEPVELPRLLEGIWGDLHAGRD